MKVSDVFTSGKSLKCEDLQGRRIPVTIESVDSKKFDDGKKLIVKFRGKEKVLIANKTNSNMIAEIAKSEDTDHWRGVQIVLIPAKTDFGGKRVDCIRIDYPEQGAAAQQKRPEPPPPMIDDDSDIPF